MPARIALCASLILSTLLQFAVAQIAGGAYGGYTDTAYFLYPGNTTRYNTTNGGPENDPVNQANGGSLTLGEETSLSAVFPWGGPWVMRINVVDGFNGPTHWVTLDDVNGMCGASAETAWGIGGHELTLIVQKLLLLISRAYLM